VLDRYCASVSTPRCVTASANTIYRFACLHRCRVIGLGDWNTWSASTECDYKMRPACLFTFCRTDCGCDARRHQRHPAAQHAAWCFNYRQAGQTHASVSKGQTGSWNLTLIYNTGFCGATERSQASYDFISRSLNRQHGRDRGGGRRDWRLPLITTYKCLQLNAR